MEGVGTVKPIPWRKVENWFCIACGDCCREFRVPLNAYEATKLAEIFGYDCLELGLKGYYLKKKPNRRCIFQIYSGGRWICGIQGIKPLACRLWPFIVTQKPRYEYKDEAEFEFRGQKVYVYLNPYCRGIIYGTPSSIFIKKVIPEFVELSLGLRREQELSTSILVSAQTNLALLTMLTAKNYELHLDARSKAIIESLNPLMQYSLRNLNIMSFLLRGKDQAFAVSHYNHGVSNIETTRLLPYRFRRHNDQFLSKPLSYYS